MSAHRRTRCACGRVHFDPLLGIVNPTGWTARQLLAMYVAGIAGAVALGAFFWVVS